MKISKLVRRLQPELREIAPYLLALTGLISAVGAVWINAAHAQGTAAARRSTTVEETAEVETVEPMLPAFEPQREGASVVRHAELKTYSPQRSRVDVLRYTVQQGDAVFRIAEKFGIEPETVLFGNYDVLNDDPHSLRPGQELNILPVDGTYYQWQAGDTIESVASEFGVEPQEILEWPGNNLNPLEPQIEPGTWLVIPGGTREFERWFVPQIARGQAGVGTAYGPGGCTGDYSGGLVGTGGFIWPAPNHYISGNDYWSGHLAIDIATGMGTGVWAADSGVVVFAGWSTVGYGYMVMIDHGNGWQTVYAHLSRVDVACGQSVGQGQRIGLAGSTGNSTGAHLHFETRFEGGFVNPWYVLP